VPPAYTTEAFLADILRAEEAARHAPETQAAFAAAEQRDDSDWLAVADALQRRLLRDAGVPPLHEADALRHLRAATYTYPALAAIPVYRRMQRARAGTLIVGDAPPDVPLLTMDGERTSLLEAASTLGQRKPVLLVAGSIS
jgi:predicted mannosyl-3-phosphoglycerate phosphatase (HAD superfamily)